MICEYCDLLIPSKGKLVGHLIDCHSDRIFYCDVCTKYADRNELIQHMAAHAIAIEKNTAAKQVSLRSKAHTSKHTLFKCIHCDKSFAHRTSLRYHMLATHQMQRDFKCDVCEGAFACKRTLRNHVNSKHGKQPLFACEKCPKTFKTDSGLYAHRKVHTDTFLVKCNLCFKNFKFRHQLTRHLTMHTKEKTHFCTFCNKGFGTRNNLTKHLKTHSNLLDFKCHICSYAASQRRYLAEHMKNTHLTVLKRDTL